MLVFAPSQHDSPSTPSAAWLQLSQHMRMLQMLARTKMVDTFRRQHGDNVHGFTKLGYQVEGLGDPEVPKPRRLEPAHKILKTPLRALASCAGRVMGGV